jgi:hypothetical protein
VVSVNLSITKAGDADLVHVKGLDKRTVLSLNNTPDHRRRPGAPERTGEPGEALLVGTKIGDAGLEHLKGLANLKELFVAGTKVSEDGAKELKEALSKLKIER